MKIEKTKEIWLDAAGKKRRITKLQSRIIDYVIDHPEANKVDISKAIGCSYTAVTKTLENPLCMEKEALIRGAVDKTRVASLQERQERLTEIIRAKITDYMDEDGNFTLNRDSPRPVAIAEYTVLETKRGEQRRLKLHSVIEAIAALDREEGVGRLPVINDQRQINITHVTVVEHPQVVEARSETVELIKEEASNAT